MKRILFTLAVLVGALLAPAAPANAVATVTHLSPDDGLDTAFLATYNGGGNVWINEGQSVANIRSIYVFDGQEIHCYFSGIGWRLWADATGSHTVGGSGMSCVMQAD